MSTSDIPQFITLTFDDGIAPFPMSLVKPLTDITDRFGCGIKSTFYVSIANTKCELVQGLYKGQHEIATHTYNHVGLPGKEEIIGAKNYLANVCGIPADEMRGFRAPNLLWNQETLDNLSDLGFLYDSSIISSNPVDSDYGRNQLWPFTLNEESLPLFMCDECPGPDKLLTSPNPGLWEIPMWIHYKADGSNELAMDYSSGDIAQLLDLTLERRYNGNRAPIGIFLHAGWLQLNGPTLKSWIKSTLTQYSDVHFVTNYELIEWMRNPVPESEYEPSCEGQVIGCLPASAQMCVFGTFNAETCECDCTSPYCTDSIGACTEVANCETSAPSTSPPCNVSDDGTVQFDDWHEYGPCCNGFQTRSRDCNIPAACANVDATCDGVAWESQRCSTDECTDALYYPIYGVKKCVADGQHRVWDTGILWDTLERCCVQYFNYELEECMDNGVPVNGGWSSISWGACDVKCGGGAQKGTRSCTNPAPVNDGAHCEGLSIIEQECNTQSCPPPVDGGWSDWNEWSHCSIACGGGKSVRTRSCNSPSPAHGGSHCVGSDLDFDAASSCNNAHVKCIGVSHRNIGVVHMGLAFVIYLLG